MYAPASFNFAMPASDVKVTATFIQTAIGTGDGVWVGSWIAARDMPLNAPTGPKYIPDRSLAGTFVGTGGLGYHAEIADNADSIKWVQVDLGSVAPIDKVRIGTLDHDFVKGFGFPLRYRLESGDDADLSRPQMIKEQTGADVANPGATVLEFDGHGVRGRYVRMTATRLFARPSKPTDFLFALKSLEVISNGKDVALDAPVTAKDSAEDHGRAKKWLTAKINRLVKPRQEAVLMRRDMDIPVRPTKAIAHVAGLGFVDFMINGRKVGDRIMAPALTDFTKRVYYDTYDVTDMLRAGHNTLGVTVGNGYFACPGRGWNHWFGVGNEPEASVDMELTMADGATQRIGTNDSWKWSTGEITFNDFYTGETQDLRLAQPGWDQPGFDDSRWLPVVEAIAPPGKLQPNPCPPVKVCAEVKPVHIEGNTYIFDGVYSGWPCVRVRGTAGQIVRIGGSAKYEFTLKGGGEETLEPRFIVQTIGPKITIDGVPPQAVVDVMIKWAHADLRRTGDFSCSNDFLNRVYNAEVRTHLNYTYDYPMDPTREKAGWTQDVQTMIDSAAYMTDMSAVYRRWWQDFRDSQTPDGAAGSVAPMVWAGRSTAGTTLGGAA